MTHTRAMEIFTIEGACINDINNGTTALQMMDMVQADLNYCDATRNRLVLTPPMDRPVPLGSGPTMVEQVELRKFRKLQEQFIRDNASNPRLFYCDVGRYYLLPMHTTDGLHPTGEPDHVGRAIVGSYMTARQFAEVRSSPTSSRIGIGL